MEAPMFHRLSAGAMTVALPTGEQYTLYRDTLGGVPVLLVVSDHHVHVKGEDGRTRRFVPGEAP
jgi:hypothetical protein